ncbi:MAG: bifunctional metallophosphatase/5'-nucleotidase [Bacteroidota bacterium]
MNFRLPYSLILLFVFISGCATGPGTQNDVAPLTILHWNDFHARNVPFEVTVTDSVTGAKQKYPVGGSATLLAYMNKAGRGKENVVLLNAGDDFQGTPVSSITMGKSQIDLMNMIKPDAVVLGNHEFDYGISELRKNLTAARYPILASNLYDSTTGSIFATASIVKTAGRVKLGIIGLLPPDLDGLTVKGTLQGMRLLNMDSVVMTHAKQLREDERVDIVVIVSHMGVDEDTMLAGRVNGIDLIVGGHSHTPLHQPIRKNKTIVVQAGSWGRYLGRLQLSVDLAGDSIRTYTGELIETKVGVYEPDPSVTSVVSHLESLVDKELNQTIGTLTVEWKRNFRGESNVGNWQADVFRSYARTDIAFMNSGGLRKDMQPGVIKKRDIWEMNPFGNTLGTFTVTGVQLKSMVEWQAAGKGELMQISGLTYEFDSSKPFGEMIASVKVDGVEIDPVRTYSIVTNNYVAGHLDKLFGLEQSVVITDLNILDRDVLMEFLATHPTVATGTEGRIVDIRSPKGSGGIK